MEQIKIQTLEELHQALAGFDTDALYRGQVRQYGPPDKPVMNTSFDRAGCIPPLMLRWSHYASFLLAALLMKPETGISIEFTQAVLQHYGWRSFYLDASSSAAVSAWFAAFSFSSSYRIELCEDCFEDPVFLRKKSARYGFEEGEGFLYVLSKDAIARNGLTSFDLSAIPAKDCRPRFHAQQAWLVGVLHGNLPSDCIVACIKGPRRVFRELAGGAGYNNTADMFPSPANDPVLRYLLALPWRKLDLPPDNQVSIDFFAQTIELPEYEDSFTKINPDYVAFYQTISSIDYLLDADIDFFTAPEDIIVGSADRSDMSFPLITNLARRSPNHVVFEIDTLVRRPGRLTSEYIKGLAVSRHEDGVFSIADFVIDHPGLQPNGCGINMGWHYRVGPDEIWQRIASSNDCTCDNSSIHEHHLSAMRIIETYLAENSSEIVRQFRRNSVA